MDRASETFPCPEEADLAASLGQRSRSGGEIQEPGTVGGVPYVIDPNGKLLELERQTANHELKMRAGGFGGGSSVIRFEGSRSPVRLQSASPIRFVLRAGGSATDPRLLFRVEQLKSAKDHREVTTVKARSPLLFGGAKSTRGAADVPFNATQCGRSSLCFTAATPLVPGEYVVTKGGYGFLFGVD